MTDGEWHGWRTPEGILRIGISPRHTQISLYIEHEDPACIHTLAHFTTEDGARTAMRLLDLLAVGVVDDESNTGGTA